MILQIKSNTEINWKAKGYDKISDNVANILKTRISEVPYMRNMGISSGYIDMPLSEIKGQLISDAIEAIAIYEPRATVKEINISDVTSEGEIVIEVVIEV